MPTTTALCLLALLPQGAGAKQLPKLGIGTPVAGEIRKTSPEVHTKELDEGYVKIAGPLLENHKIFPDRTNVQMAKVLSRDRVQILIWERGAGYTLASGSSSCAVAAAAVKNGLTDNTLSVLMPGGELQIEVRKDWTIKMRGPVEEVFTGTFSKDLLKRLTSTQP